MKKSRDILENNLLLLTQKYNNDKNVEKEIVKVFKEHNLPQGNAYGLIDQNKPIKNRDLVIDYELYYLAKAIFTKTGEPSIKIEDYFTQSEIDEYENFKFEDNEHIKSLKFEDTKQIADNQYICPYVDIREIEKYISHGVLTYYLKTQRTATYVRFGDELLETATIKEDAVKSIEQSILNNKFTQNMISFNIRRTGREVNHLKFNSKNTFLIEVDRKDCFCDIVDGMHRILGAIRALRSNPNLKFGFIINILHYTEAQAKEYIVQEYNRTPMDEVSLAAYKESEPGIALAKQINNYGSEMTNVLFNKFANSTDEIKYNNKYLTYDTFNKAIEHNFNITEPIEIMELQEYLIKFFNKLIGSLKRNNANSNLAFHNMMFLGYIALAESLKNKELDIEKYISDIDFNNIDFWSNLEIIPNVYPKINKSKINKISKYFKNLVRSDS